MEAGQGMRGRRQVRQADAPSSNSSRHAASRADSPFSTPPLGSTQFFLCLREVTMHTCAFSRVGLSPVMRAATATATCRGSCLSVFQP